MRSSAKVKRKVSFIVRPCLDFCFMYFSRDCYFEGTWVNAKRIRMYFMQVNIVIGMSNSTKTEAGPTKMRNYRINWQSINFSNVLLNICGILNPKNT